MSVEYENLLPSNFPSPTRSTSKRTRAVLIVTKSKKVAPLPKTVSSPRRTSPRKPPLQLAPQGLAVQTPRPAVPPPLPDLLLHQELLLLRLPGPTLL